MSESTYTNMFDLRRTLVIIFAPLTLVHVMIAIYVCHVCPVIGPCLLTRACTARVLRPSTRSMADVGQARTYARRGGLYLCLVCSPCTGIRQLLHLRDPLCVIIQHGMVQSNSSHGVTREPRRPCRKTHMSRATRPDLLGRSRLDHVLLESYHQPLQDFREG